MVEPSMMMESGLTRQRSASRERIEQNGGGLNSHLSHIMWEAGSRQMHSALSSYGRVDLLRPYFDVEPKQVRSRLLQSLMPRRPSLMIVTQDMYGPLMLICTLVALLLFEMKASGYTAQDGTLVGTAFVTCFGYWLLTSLLLYTVCYVFLCDVPLVHICSLLGYALFGHCIVVFLTAIFHPVHSHLFFYALLFIFAVPSCARMAIYLTSKTRDRSHKLILAGVIFFFHLSFLCYLHFGFHTVIEEIEEMFGDAPAVDQIVGVAAQLIPAAETVPK